jgi:hypothetical protein
MVTSLGISKVPDPAPPPGYQVIHDDPWRLVMPSTVVCLGDGGDLFIAEEAREDEEPVILPKLLSL